ncbi:ABC transporter substrate-binding protein [Desulfoluna limicola]|uniref:ABC transporter substrate-binding protein n=1 Tax=Desulfoluna limicola TaxID=2810562 RepID=A0ABM7PDP7_9BACT|nr:ABC transporter substrate-binding protein [Desulfoluna limicola]BCS95213.1 ABC transporter substrate-binding protein [Desulfoluna limicola]
MPLEIKADKGCRAVRSLLVVVFLLLCACTRDSEPIKIGAIIPLTGAASQHVVFVDAMTLAMDEINATGGVNGRKLKLIVTDSQSNPEEGRQAFVRMEKAHHPLVYLTTTSVVSLALAPLAEETRVVLVGMAASSPRVTPGRQWVFKYYITPEDEVVPIVSHLKWLKIRTLGILYQDDAFGRSLNTVVTQRVESLGARAVSVPFAASDPRFAEKIARINDMEAIYVVGFVRVAGKAILALREQQYPGTILAYSGASSLPQAMPEMLPQLEGIYLAAPIIYNPNYVFARKAKERYERRFNQNFTHQAANGYDFIHILAGLMEGEDVSRERVRERLNSEFSYPGVFGYIEKDAGQHDIAFPLYPARIVNGTIHYLQ